MNREHLQKDEKILQAILEGNESVFKKLFEDYWQEFRLYFLREHKLSEEEVLEIYCSTFATLHLKIQNGKLTTPLTSLLKTFVFGIGKNQVLQHFDRIRRKREVSVEDWHKVYGSQHELSDVEALFKQEYAKNIVERMISSLGEKCQKLIKLTFWQKFADESIMEQMGFPSTIAVRQKRFKCIETLRNLFNRDGKMKIDE